MHVATAYRKKLLRHKKKFVLLAICFLFFFVSRRVIKIMKVKMHLLLTLPRLYRTKLVAKPFFILASISCAKISSLIYFKDKID